MNNQIVFLLIVLASSLAGIFLSILNNNISQENQGNLKKDDIKKTHEEDNKNITPNDIKPKFNESDKINNPKIKINDFIDDEKDEQNNKIENITDNNIINYIHIGFSLDNRFIYPLLACLTSLLENRASTTFYRIHIQTSKNIKQENLGKIDKLIKRYGKQASKVSYYNMGDDFKGAITGSHISLASYYRIALPSLLPNVDKIIYCDADVINFKDLSEMYNLKFRDKIYFMSTLDNVGLLNELKQLGVYTQKYMNAGILLMNLKAIREDGIEQKIRRYIFSHYLDHHDQTAINAVCYKNIDVLSCKYSTFVFNSLDDMKKFNNKQNKLYRYNDKELNQAFYDPCLLHYVGWTKPWDKPDHQVYDKYWWYYAKISGFYDEILRNYNIDKKIVEKMLAKIPKDGGLIKINYRK